MFRKPKRLASKKTRRKRENEDDEEADGDRSETNATSLFSTCVPVRGGGDDDDRKRRKTSSSSGLMHEFSASSSSDARPTAKELATREAEHHPVDKGNSTAGAGGKRNKFLAGPIRAPTFVRTTCRFDYQPDICKDYKETGFCGFGDTCIYLHDRGDTLSGWQLEREWEERKQKERDRQEREMERFMKSESSSGCGAMKDGGDDDEGETNGTPEDDGLPFACHVCRGPFVDPVVTVCQHYFCEKCISESYRHDRSCPVCKKDTSGVFNFPQKLVAKRKKVLGRREEGGWKAFFEKQKERSRKSD